jgi:cytochrome c-type biogenesis protein CcmF
MRANPRRYGGYVAHIGILMSALGIIASSSFRSEREMTLKEGQVLTVAGRSVRLRNVWGREEPQRSVIGATLDVLDHKGNVTGQLEPRMNYYRASDTPVPTPDVRSSVKGDLYANLMAFDSAGTSATVKLIVEPLVPWIWFGGFVIVLGALISMAQRIRIPQRVGETTHAATAPVPAAPAAEVQPVAFDAPPS